MSSAMIPLRATLFETLHLSTDDGQVFDLGTPTARSLAAYLLLHRARPIDRRRLAFLFWPNAAESAARRNLRQYLHHLRQVFDNIDPFLLLSDGSTLQINPQADIWLDVEVFRQGAQPGATLEAAEAALDLYQGDLLAELYDEWCEVERQQLRELYLQTLERVTRALQLAGQLEKAIIFARRWTQAEPLDENAQRRLMILYSMLGDRSRAIQQYQNFARSLREELDADPLPETQELLQSIQTGTLLPEREPPVRTPQPVRRLQVEVPHNLPLIGREREQRQMAELLVESTHQPGRMLFINGEAGIGKTRLIQEYLHEHPEVPVIYGSCYELDKMSPYAPLRHSLDNHPVMKTLLAQLRSQPPGWLPTLASLLPSVAQIFPYIMGTQAEPTSLRDAWVHLLEALARQSEQPLHIILDDLHWADTSTWELLAVLSRTNTPSLLVIGLLRMEDLPAEHLPLLRTIERAGLALSLPLPRLNYDFTALLVRAIYPERGEDILFLQHLHQDTAGNPFFIIETVRALKESGPDVRALPPSIQRVIEARLEQLSPSGQDALGMAAVIGRSFNFAQLQHITQMDSASLLLFFEEWTQRGLIYESEQGYDFRHDQFRQVAYARLSRARREFAHHQVADVLSNSLPKADAASLAYHYSHSDQPLLALPHLAQAGEQALRFRSYYEARQFGQQAVSLLGKMPGPGQRAERVDANLQLAQAYAFTGDLQRAIEIIIETEHLATTLGDEARLGQIFRRAAQFFWLNGNPLAASDYARRALRVAEEQENPELLLATLRMLGRVSIALAAFDDAIAYLQRYVNRGEQNGIEQDSEDLPIVLGYLGVAYARVGAWERAITSAQQGKRLAQERSATVSDEVAIFARMQLAMVYASQQDWEACLETLDFLPALAETITPPMYMAYSLRGLARSHIRTRADGIADLQKAINWAETNHYRVFHYRPRIYLAESLLLDGQLESALREANLSLDESRQAGNRWACGIALRLLAEIRARQTNPAWSQVENDLLESMNILRQVRARPDLARTYLSLRRLYDRAGQIAWAVDCHFRATTIFEELGMSLELRHAQGHAAGERKGAVVIPNLGLRGPIEKE